MADEAPKRPMKFPYTYSAKIAQFPLKFYIQNQWIWKYYVVGLAVSLPVFYKIHKLCKSNTINVGFKTEFLLFNFFLVANSPENVAKWADIRRKEAAEHH